MPLWYVKTCVGIDILSGCVLFLLSVFSCLAGYAQAYYDKLLEVLDHDDYHRIMSLLHDFDGNVNTVTDLYHEVEHILGGKHPELLTEFLSFLTPIQAQNLGKLVPHFMLSNMSLFLRKVMVTTIVWY